MYTSNQPTKKHTHTKTLFFLILGYNLFSSEKEQQHQSKTEKKKQKTILLKH